MFFDDFICNVKILTVLKLSWDSSDADAAPRKFHALSFRVTGDACYSYDDNTIQIQAGDVLFVPEDVGYHIKAQKEELYAIHYKLDEKKQSTLEAFHVTDKAKLQRLFSACYEVWSKKEPGYYFKALSIFYNILQLMYASSSNILTDESYLEMKLAIDYLHAHFSDPDCSVLTLCNLANMSDTWFRKLFFKYYGTTPVKYINNLRINYAKELIESGYYKIEQISEKAGFGSSKYFSTVFKQYAGCSPSDYSKTLN